MTVPTFADKTTYWVYENWTHKKALLHKGDCGSCNHGQGIHVDAGSHNGRWHGPFETHDEAASCAAATGRQNVRGCKRCLG